MREIRTSGLMSGDGKRGGAAWPKATAPVLDSTVSSTQGGGDLLPRGNAVSVVAVGALPLIPRIGGGGNKRGHESGRHEKFGRRLGKCHAARRETPRGHRHGRI